jgi:hypothetical protein
MKIKYTHSIIAAALFCALAVTTTVAQSADPLPSWNDGKTKQSILTFVSKVTKNGEREWNYDVTPLGRLEKGLEEAKAKGWTLVDMKNEWKVIYPFEKK